MLGECGTVIRGPQALHLHTGWAAGMRGRLCSLCTCLFRVSTGNLSWGLMPSRGKHGLADRSETVGVGYFFRKDKSLLAQIQSWSRDGSPSTHRLFPPVYVSNLPC